MASRTKPAGLGRGLGELFQNTDTDHSANPNAAPVAMPEGASFAEIPVASITPNPRQPRTAFDEDQLTELAASIKDVGLLQPIVVRPLGDSTYELVMGERRFRATKEAGLDTIPAIIRPTEEADLLRDALLENLHRAQLNPLEEAAAYQQLLDDFGITQEQLAERIGRSRPQITNTLRLLKLPESVQRRVAAGVLTAGHARALLSLPDDAGMERLAEKIVNEELSVRAAEAAAGSISTKPARVKPSRGKKQGHLDEIAERLADRLNTRVKVTLGATKGQVVIDFATVGDLNRILEELGDTGFSR